MTVLVPVKLAVALVVPMLGGDCWDSEAEAAATLGESLERWRSSVGMPWRKRHT
jgi:hypothetical protein